MADILGLLDYVHNSGDHPDSAYMHIDWIEAVGCKREGRRFVGQYVSSQNDVMTCRNGSIADPHGMCVYNDKSHLPQEPFLPFDRVAYAGWSFDLHNPKGMRDHATMGQAAGTAAAYSLKHKLPPIELKDHPEAVWSIQQQLLRDDAYIIDMLNEDPRDHARKSRVSATTEVSPGSSNGGLDGRALNVISGQSRAAVTGPKGGGIPPSQGLNGTNRWISQGLPAALTLTLAAPIAIAQVQLVFDTGMHRKLNLSPLNAAPHNSFVGWNPQAETVRNYAIEGQGADGRWTVLCNVSGNYQRRRVHALPCPSSPPVPPPPPTPPTATGAVSTTDCDPTVASQQWAVAADGTVSAVVAGAKLCLGYSSSIAFGGQGQAVTAAAADCAPTGTRWQWADAGGGASLLQIKGKAVKCANPDSPACDVNATDVSSPTVRGAGDAACNGVYKRTALKQDGLPVLSLDDTHQLYRNDGVWHMAHEGVGVYYEATTAGLAGPPQGASGWKAVGNTSAPVPSLVSCAGGAPSSCGCAHAVPCAACHTTTSGTRKWIAPTSVELAPCVKNADDHILWSQLFTSAGAGKSGIVMSGGLCLAAARGNGTLAQRKKPAARTRLLRSTTTQRAAGAAPPVVKAVRVTVTGTNGCKDARINEVRLYDAEGEAPFPEKPLSIRKYDSRAQPGAQTRGSCKKDCERSSWSCSARADLVTADGAPLAARPARYQRLLRPATASRWSPRRPQRLRAAARTTRRCPRSSAWTSSPATSLAAVRGASRRTCRS